MRENLRALLGFLAAGAMLPACGGLQNATPQSVEAQSRVRRASGSYGDLIYVSTSKAIVVLAYPGLKIVQSLPVSYAYSDICSDPKNGNVYIVEKTQVVVYAHGGTSPIGSLGPPLSNGYMQACSVDPLTGNLAVSFNMYGYKQGAILVYPSGQGTPTVYADKKLSSYLYTTYDDSGDLFFGAYGTKGNWRIEKLVVAKGRFSGIRTNIGFGLYKIQWDGSYIVFEEYFGKGHGSVVYQLQITGNYGTIINQMNFFDAGSPSNFAVDFGALFNALGQVKNHRLGGIGGWSYPSGGDPFRKRFGVSKGPNDKIIDMAFSTAP